MNYNTYKAIIHFGTTNAFDSPNSKRNSTLAEAIRTFFHIREVLSVVYAYSPIRIEVYVYTYDIMCVFLQNGEDRAFSCRPLAISYSIQHEKYSSIYLGQVAHSYTGHLSIRISSIGISLAESLRTGICNCWLRGPKFMNFCMNILSISLSYSCIYNAFFFKKGIV